MQNLTMNVSNEGLYVSLASLSQILNMASKIDMVIPSAQYQDLPPSPRIPGAGKEFILHIAPDFDAVVEFANNLP